MRTPFVAGNWKMNTDSQSSVALAESVASAYLGSDDRSVHVAVIPPFVYLQAVAKAVGASGSSGGRRMVLSGMASRMPRALAARQGYSELGLRSSPKLRRQLIRTESYPPITL